MANGASLQELVSHPEHGEAYRQYCQQEAQKWLEIAVNLCDGSEENLPRYAYAMRRYRDFMAKTA